ncbi:MAG: group II intron reverse transcriptase/maturase [Colwellia polaris]|jgi:RNA-directed DNA polymerase
MHLNTSTLPSDNDVIEHGILTPALHENLIDKLLTPANLASAWKRVKANRGSAGIDGMTIDDFPAFANANWENIKTQITQGTYRPGSVLRVNIPKPDGGSRGLGIPTVLDRFIQQAIHQVLNPIFDPHFSPYSFGFRPNCNAAQAVKHLQTGVKSGRKIAVDIDLSKFFDRVNHDLLMHKIGLKVKDKVLMTLIGRYLRARIVEHGKRIKPTQGVPQGGPLSPLLSNIMLDELDETLVKRGHHFARYADDFTILVKSKRAGERILASMSLFIQQTLKLVVNEKKSRVGAVKETKFLGFGFKYGRINIHDNSLHRFKYRVRALTNRNWGIAMSKQIASLNRYLRGWGNYFLIANGYQLCVDLDQWIRRRIRMCYWRQWRKPRTKVNNLLKRGVPLALAVSCGATRKGVWRSAKTKGINLALSNEYLAKAGLVSLRDIWIKIHHG